jgi:hypothetical protein
MGTLAVGIACYWILLMLWVSVHWYPSTVDRICHFLYQMFLLAVFLLTYLAHGAAA